MYSAKLRMVTFKLRPQISCNNQLWMKKNEQSITNQMFFNKETNVGFIKLQLNRSSEYEVKKKRSQKKDLWYKYVS